MAAGDQLRAFRKGHLASNSKNPYQDPTHLTFTIMFDVSSALFNKNVAVASLRDEYKDPVRADKLSKFIDTLLMINSEMPWYWKSITGVERAFSHDMTSPYWGGDDAILTLDCNESINLPITGLMDMYKESVYDLKAWTQILPQNYRWFDMHVIVSEIRTIRSIQPTKNGLEKQINDDMIDSFKPHFMFTFKKCQFQTDSGKETFETLTSNNTDNPSPKIRIKYEAISKTNASYLNGISTAEITELPGISDQTPNQTFAERTQAALNDAAATVMDGITGFNPIEEFTRPNNVYGSVLDQAFERAVGEIDDIAGGLGNIGDNLFKGGVGSLTREGQGLIVSAKENIFGLDRAATLGAALRQGAINSIFPMINNTGGNNKEDLGNTFGK